MSQSDKNCSRKRKLTPKQQVISRFPKAMCFRDKFGRFVISDSRLLGGGAKEAEAWATSAQIELLGWRVRQGDGMTLEEREAASDIIFASLAPSSTAAISTDEARELNRRIDAALDRIQNGHAVMRVPADPTDPDLVLAACRQALSKIVFAPSATASALPADVVTVLRHARMYIANRGAFRPYQSMLDELHEVMERHGLNGEKANG